MICWESQILLTQKILNNVYVSQSVVVKGLERNIANLYEARRLLLGLDSCEVSMATKDSYEVSIVPKSAIDPLLANSGVTNYWLNMLMQQLHVTETGVCMCVCVMIKNSMLSVTLTFFKL